MRELLAHAAHLGVQVYAAHLPAPYLGFYDHQRRRIVYDIDLAPIERASVLAHELGHAFYGHCGRDGDAEAEADAYAAALLVDPERCARLEELGLGPDEMAEELGVTVKLLRAFVENHVSRVHGVAYVRPRLGRGQYDHAARWAS